MNNDPITEDEILNAEKAILEHGYSFNDDQKGFLDCFNSCDVQAYAGTGKTSALVGKLHILSQRNIWGNGRGICVISHTNVAVDEVKKHVALHYPDILNYPNFIGTIQEFANKFLLIPYLSSQSQKIRFQDETRYLSLKNYPIVYARLSRYRNQMIRFSGKFERFSECLSKCFVYNNEICYFEDGEIKSFLAVFDKFITKACNETLIKEALMEAILNRHKEGYFLFNESFTEGSNYLKKYPIIKQALQKRFKYVFLDEAQDCSGMQLNLIYDLFKTAPETIFQELGDINQSITENKWIPKDDALTFAQSTRFGNNICGFINGFQTFQSKNTSGVQGTSKTTKKYLIKYNTGKEEKVIEKFAELLSKDSIPYNEDHGFFAIAYRHDDLAKYLPDYSQTYAKEKSKKNAFKFKSDSEYINLLKYNSIKLYGAKYVNEVLCSLIYKHSQDQTQSLWSIKRLLREREKSVKFRELIILVCQDISKNGRISDIPDLQKRLNEIIGGEYINLSDLTPANTSSIESSKLGMINSYRDTTSNISIRFGTIHSVKGQTHDATLFFSAHSDRKQDFQHTIDNTKVHTPKYKKLLYVASSRAKYLFAVAIENNSFNSLTNSDLFKDFIVVEQTDS